MFDAFLRKLREGNEQPHEQSVRQVGKYEGYKVYSNPLVVRYTKPNEEITLLFDRQPEPPSMGEIVLVLFEGAQIPVLVRYTEDRTGEKGKRVTSMVGTKVKI
jgi:hypothetical protein